MGTDGEVANALVCKTSIHGFKSHSVLQIYSSQLTERFLLARWYTEGAGGWMIAAAGSASWSAGEESPDSAGQCAG